MAATIDRRAERHPVWTHDMTQMTWAAAVTTAQDVDIPINGILTGFSAKLNNCTNAITITVAFYNSDDGSMHSTAAIARNATTFTGSLAVPLDGNCYVKVTPSGAPGASTLTVDLLLTGY